MRRKRMPSFDKEGDGFSQEKSSNGLKLEDFIAQAVFQKNYKDCNVEARKFVDQKMQQSGIKYAKL
jgi:hypothetical protein